MIMDITWCDITWCHIIKYPSFYGMVSMKFYIIASWYGIEIEKMKFHVMPSHVILNHVTWCNGVKDVFEQQKRLFLIFTDYREKIHLVRAHKLFHNSWYYWRSHSFNWILVKFLNSPQKSFHNHLNKKDNGI